MIDIYLVRYFKFSCIIFLFLLSFSIKAKRPEYHIEIKNHLFYPAKIAIPANEKVIFPHRSATIFIGPLPAGEYSFFGEYNPHSARGKIIVGETSQYQDFNKGEQNVN